MEASEVENLLNEAVKARPTVTNSPLNLYVYDGRVLCGARALMPADADFVAHVPPYELENGFSPRQWKAMVERVRHIAGGTTLTVGARASVDTMKRAGERNFEDRRSERRLRYHHPVWFGSDHRRTDHKGQMCDVCSGGIGFTCEDANQLDPGREIVTRFSAPRYHEDNSFDIVSFSRTGRVCRVDKNDSLLRRVGIQFAQPLPFKPGEQRRQKTPQAVSN